MGRKAKLWSADVFDSISHITGRGSDAKLPQSPVAVLIERALRPSPMDIQPQMIELQKAGESSQLLRAKKQYETERMATVRLE